MRVGSTSERSERGVAGEGRRRPTERSKWIAGPLLIAVASGCGPDKPDTTVPQIAISTPAANATIAAMPLTVTGTATDAGGNLAEVRVTAGGTTANATIGSGGSWTATIAGLTDGAAQITAEAEDEGGFTASAGPVAVNVDLTAPALEILSPDAGALLGSPDDLTAGGGMDTTVVVSVEDGAGLGADGQTVEIREGATPLCSGPIAAGAASLTCAIGGDGPHSLTATVTDLAGHPGTSSAVALTVDLTAPTISVSPSATTINSSTSGVLPSVLVTSNAGSGQLVTLFVNGQPSGTQAISGTTATFTNVTLTSGQNSIAAGVFDPAGNSALSSSAAVLYDPVVNVAIVSPSPNQLFGGASVLVSVATDTDVAQVNVNGQLRPVVNGAASATVLLGAEGNNAITAAATDAAGNTSNAMVTVRLDSIAPAISVTGPGPVLTSLNDLTPLTPLTQASVQVRVLDASVQGRAVSYTANGRPASGTSLITGTSASLTMSLLEGSNELLATVTDSAGNVATSAPMRVIVLGGPTYTVTGTVRDASTGMGVPGARVEMSSSSFFDPIVASAIATGTSGAFSVSLPPGEFAVRAYEDLNANGMPDGVERRGWRDGGALLVSPEVAFQAPITANLRVSAPGSCTITGTVSNDVGWGATRTWVTTSDEDQLRISTLTTGGSFTIEELAGTETFLIFGKDVDGDSRPSAGDAIDFSFAAGSCGTNVPHTMPGAPTDLSGTVTGGEGWSVLVVGAVGAVTVPVQPDGTWTARTFAENQLFVYAFLDREGNAFVDGNQELFTVYGAVLDGSTSSISGIDLAAPTLRLIEGTVTAVTDFRVRASSANGLQSSVAWTEPGSNSYAILAPSSKYDVSVFDDVDADGEIDAPEEYSEVLLDVDANAGDRSGQNVTVRPDLRLQFVKSTDTSPDGTLDGVINPNESVDFSVRLRNRGGNAQSVNGTLNFVGPLFWVNSVSGAQSYGTIAPRATSAVGPSYTVGVTNFAQMREFLNFSLSLTASGYGPVDRPFSKYVGGVLLVDDDQSAGGAREVRPIYAAALDGAFLDFEVTDVVGAATDGPTAATMDQYGATLWFTGESATPITANDRTAITTLTNLAQRRLHLFSNGYLDAFDPGGTGAATDPFTTNVFGVNACVRDVGGFDTIASGTFFSFVGGAASFAKRPFDGADMVFLPFGAVRTLVGDVTISFDSNSGLAAQRANVGTAGNARTSLGTVGLESLEFASDRVTYVDDMLRY